MLYIYILGAVWVAAAAPTNSKEPVHKKDVVPSVVEVEHELTQLNKPADPSQSESDTWHPVSGGIGVPTGNENKPLPADAFTGTQDSLPDEWKQLDHMMRDGDFFPGIPEEEITPKAMVVLDRLVLRARIRELIRRKLSLDQLIESMLEDYYVTYGPGASQVWSGQGNGDVNNVLDLLSRALYESVSNNGLPPRPLQMSPNNFIMRPANMQGWPKAPMRKQQTVPVLPPIKKQSKPAVPQEQNQASN